MNWFSRVSVGIVSGIIGSISIGDAAPLCSQPPKGLRSGQLNTHGEALAFSYQSNSYPVDLFSGYARRSNSGIDYCLRYEAINKGPAAIERFFWPLASNLEIKSFAPMARPSITITAKSENPPAIVATKVYAFAREQVNSRAYKAEGQQTNEAATQNSSTPAYAQQSSQRIALKEPATFSDIGTQFTDDQVEVTASTSANWDGKNLAISVAISVSNDKLISNLRAPVVFALAKGISDEKIFYATARQLASAPLYLRDNQFAFSPKFEINRAELFIIKSPIAFTAPTGRVCFVAEAYSPVPFPSDTLNCSSLE